VTREGGATLVCKGNLKLGRGHSKRGRRQKTKPKRGSVKGKKGEMRRKESENLKKKGPRKEGGLGDYRHKVKKKKQPGGKLIHGERK